MLRFFRHIRKKLEAINRGELQYTKEFAFLKNDDIQAAMRLFTSLSTNALGTLPPFLHVNDQLINQLEKELKE